MHVSIQLTTTTNPTNRSSLRPGFLFISLALALACFALAPLVCAVSPPPDGDYGSGNTAEGQDALFYLTTGIGNTAIGLDALFNNTSGNDNTAIGREALKGNTTGAANTADGLNALFNNTTGIGNTANGWQALFSNTTASNNSALGDSSLYSNTTGFDNTASGVGALFSNTTGSNNSAIGFDALYFNTTGIGNTAHGLNALVNNTTGINNTAQGSNALFSNTTGNSNIALGVSAGTSLSTGSNNIDIGNAGVAGESKTIRIGTRPTHKATYIAGISGATVAGGVGVIIDTNGHLGTVVSSGRYKDSIKPMDKASESILALKPVTFHYKPELDPAGIPQFGLVAEQVEKVNPALVARDDQGKPYTVRYEAVNAMLLNEFLKEHRKVETLETTVAKLESALKEQATQLQKVCALVEANKPAPRLVLNNP